MTARPRLSHAALLLPLAAVVVWVATRGRAVHEDPVEVLLALRAAHGPSLPSEQLVKASSRAAPTTYDRETLYQYIDGAAEAFLARGFQRCATASYSFAAAAGGVFELVAEVYRFASPDGAADQLQADTPAAARPVTDLPGALADGTTLVLVVGSDLLKLTVFDPTPEAAGALRAVAAAWREERGR